MNSRTSPIRRSGTSIAGRCPPQSNSDQGSISWSGSIIAARNAGRRRAPTPAGTITTAEGKRPYNDQAFWVSHASLPGLPAVAAPTGRTPGGLPVGAQIVGPLYEVDTAIAFAELLGDAIGGYLSEQGHALPGRHDW
jgi:hypothetical protein